MPVLKYAQRTAVLCAHSFFIFFAFSVAAYAQTPGGVLSSTTPFGDQDRDAMLALIVAAFVIFLYILFIFSVLKKYTTIPRNEAFTYGWRTMKKHAKFFIPIILMLWILTQIPNIIDWLVTVTKKPYPQFSLTVWKIVFGPKSLFVGLMQFLTGTYALASFLKVACILARNGTARFHDMFVGGVMYLRVVGGTLLFLLAFLGGLALFIVPGIIVAISLSFWPYYIIDQGMSPVRALKASWAMTKGKRWELFLFSLLIQTINMLTLPLIVVGPFVIPVFTTFATLYVYSTLAKRTMVAERPAS